VLLYPHQDAWYLPLTLRPKNLPDHPGQVSLPGGAIEPGETSREAALREFHEELGGQGPRIELLGPLSPIYLHVSNFHVKPWLGVCRQRPPLTPNPSEVETIFEVPLPHLLDPANFGSHRRKSGDRSFIAPHFLWQSHQIWGATCMILGELITIVEGL
jgi:8-oxo-dGTP pyrophosphatase MutT (NUDIX family)